MRDRIRLILVDDHRLFRDGLKALLRSFPELAIVGEANDARSALDLVDHVESDLIVLEIALPGSNGLALLRELRRRRVKQRAVVLTRYRQPDMVADALTLGAAGYVVKDQSVIEVVEAIRSAARHLRCLAPGLSYPKPPSSDGEPEKVPGVLSPLSWREREIFDLIVQGDNTAQIAARLFISAKTVETHRCHIMRKLNVHNIGELIRLAARHGFFAA